jgi:hypothetical protein
MKLACYIRGDMDADFDDMDEFPFGLKEHHFKDGEEDDDPQEHHPILISVKKKMLEAIKNLFAPFEQNTLYKLASTFDPR